MTRGRPMYVYTNGHLVMAELASRIRRLPRGARSSRGSASPSLGVMGCDVSARGPRPLLARDCSSQQTDSLARISAATHGGVTASLLSRVALTRSESASANDASSAMSGAATSVFLSAVPLTLNRELAILEVVSDTKTGRRVQSSGSPDHASVFLPWLHLSEPKEGNRGEPKLGSTVPPWLNGPCTRSECSAKE
jgi:hypothetical protein